MEAHNGEEGGSPKVFLPAGVAMELVELIGLNQEEENPQDDGDEKAETEGAKAAPPQVVMAKWTVKEELTRKKVLSRASPKAGRSSGGTAAPVRRRYK